jgi:hypothetical protein
LLVWASSTALRMVVTATRRASCLLCAAIAVAWAVAIASSSLLFASAAAACYSSGVRLEVEIVLAPVIAREASAAGVVGVDGTPKG